MKIFFTSDTHFNHKNIVRGISSWDDKSSCRDFSTLSEMNEALIQGINDVVQADDVLFHLGDFAFGDPKSYREFRHKLHCKKIHLIYGNHDKRIYNNEHNLQDLFATTGFYREININGQKINMSHYGFRVWNESHRGSWMLYGHSHGTLSPMIAGPLVIDLLDKKRYTELRELAQGLHPTQHPNGKSLDVGVDTHPEFRPYSLEELSEIMSKRNMVQVDDHIPNTHHA
jgi:calcineurin-like phosphoesterase family protein